MSNKLSQDAVRAHLSGHPWQDTILVFDQVVSTNTTAKELAAAGAPEGTVVIADSQSGGRGRLGRSFLSPGGCGIYLSLILRPNLPPAQMMHLTCAVADAACSAVAESAGFRPQIKWTNDLVWNGKKLAGILTELSLGKSGNAAYAVVGIGINCRQKPEDFDPAIRDLACSAEMICGKAIDRNQLAGAIIRRLHQMRRDLISEKGGILDRYRRDCITLGREVSIIKGDTVRRGRALDIDGEGGLIVAFEGGSVETVSAGEVSVRGLYGYT